MLNNTLSSTLQRLAIPYQQQEEGPYVVNNASLFPIIYAFLLFAFLEQYHKIQSAFLFKFNHNSMVEEL